MDYGEDGLRGITVSADICKFKKNEIVIALRAKNEEPLGLQLTLSRKLFKNLDSEVFLKLKESFNGKAAIEAGLRLPF